MLYHEVFCYLIKSLSFFTALPEERGLKSETDRDWQSKILGKPYLMLLHGFPETSYN